MFRFIWTLSVRTRDYLHRYMPSNRLLAAIRTRRGLKWGLPAMLVAAPYLLVATFCSDLCQRQPAVVEVGYFVEARGIDSRTADRHLPPRQMLRHGPTVDTEA